MILFKLSNYVNEWKKCRLNKVILKNNSYPLTCLLWLPVLYSPLYGCQSYFKRNIVTCQQTSVTWWFVFSSTKIITFSSLSLNSLISSKTVYEGPTWPMIASDGLEINRWVPILIIMEPNKNRFRIRSF